MDRQWLEEMIAVLRQVGTDTQRCEVKEAAGGLPKSIVETLSAFSNAAGGIIILGLSEREGFVPVDGFDARAIQDALASACEKLSPVVRPDIEVLPFEDATVVCARVEEMHPRDKPCYVLSRGVYQGSYVRTADGDRRLSSYEIDRLLEEHHQPTHDDEAVFDAALSDFDSELLEGFIRRQKSLHPRILGNRPDEDVLLDLHVIKRTGDELHPTLAGLMSMGTFPQKFFPRLNVTFTAFAGIDKATPAAGGKRFLDSRTIIGPIPYMIEDVLHAVERNMKTGAVINGAFRKDVPDYPLVAVREAVANALMHRDYSPDSRGSQVQVNLYADRLEVLNPGGLYGDVTVDTLGISGVSSSRNQFLSNILETVPYPGGGYVVENRGTGYQEIERELKDAMMPEPRPYNSTTHFSLTFDKRHLDPSEGIGAGMRDVDAAILAYLKENSSATTAEMVAASGLARSTVSAHLRSLVKQGRVEALEPARSPRQRYRFVE